MNKPRLLFFFNGLPEYEVMFNIAIRLKERGVVEPVCFSPSQVLKREPRLRPLISASNLNFKSYHSRWLKFLPKRWLKRGDAVITLSDPHLDESASRPRSLAMINMDMPTIFIQHGVVQEGLNVSSTAQNIKYSSQVLLVFENTLIPQVLCDDTHKKLSIVGFIKPKLFAPIAPKKTLPKHNRAILFCHSFRWKGRYGEEDVNRFYDLVGQFAKDNPNDLIIIRGHRAKSRASYKAHDKALANVQNIIFSNAYKGPLKGMSMTDVLAICDMCISTASTAILDSVYMNIPTAVYENDQPVFSQLPNITGRESLENFVANPETSNISAVQKHYGKIAQNIERSCDVIEDTMLRIMSGR